jgi:hypothetical protein
MRCTYRKFIRPFPLKPLTPEVLPVVEVTIVRAADASGLVEDVALAPTEPVQRAIDWYAAGCPPWRKAGAWGECDACLVSGGGELVPLVDGVCPRCRTDWRTDAQKIDGAK